MRNLIAAAVIALGGGAAKAESVADFYKGKNVTVLVGYGTGGGYDVYARMISRHFGRHLPGNPNMIVQNMPGAGSLRATNHLYVSAPKDGTMFGTFARNMPLLGVLGGTAEGATGNDVALLIQDTLGMNFKLITGYPDSGALFIGIERGELDGRFVGLSAVSSNKPEWLKPGGPVKVLLQFARRTRHPDYPDVPTARELAKEGRAKQLIQLAEIPYMLSRPYAAPPGVPADRAKALRAAFDATTTDKTFLAEAAKLGLDVSPVGADEAMEMLDLLAAAPEELKDALRKLQGR